MNRCVCEVHASVPIANISEEAIPYLAQAFAIALETVR
jgi:hypothetical protein